MVRKSKSQSRNTQRKLHDFYKRCPVKPSELARTLQGACTPGSKTYDKKFHELTYKLNPDWFTEKADRESGYHLPKPTGK